jgi:hypothetical protein
MGKVTALTAIIGTIVAALTFYFSAYLPYIEGEDASATPAPVFSPVINNVVPDNNNPPEEVTETSDNTDSAYSSGTTTTPSEVADESKITSDADPSAMKQINQVWQERFNQPQMEAAKARGIS